MQEGDMSEGDNLTGVFDSLTPEDFHKEPTPTPRVVFARFVEANVDVLRKSYIAAEGNMQTIAILESHDTETIVTVEDDETLGEYVQRVRDEAREAGAIRLFMGRQTMVANKMIEIDQAAEQAVDSSSWVEENQGLLEEGMFYYAEWLQGGEREARIGILRIRDGRLCDRVEVDARIQPVELFANMLS